MFGNVRETWPKSNYGVLWKRDAETEKRKGYDANIQLFDQVEWSSSEQEALKYHFRNLPSIAFEIVDSELPEKILLISQNYGKYRSSCMGEVDALRTFDVANVQRGDLGALVEKLSRDKTVEKLFLARKLDGGI